MRRAFKIALATAAAAGAFGAMQAQAAVIVSCGGASSCITGTDNVLLTDATNVTVGAGETNTTPAAPVKFTTTESGLNLSASGQAVITAVDQVLNNLTFALLNGFTFQKAEFNLTNAIRSPVSVTVSTNTGSSATYNILNGNGSNRFGITADAGEFLTAITFNSAVGFDSFRQLRIGGVAGEGITPAVPEPATWLMMLLGFGAIGWSMRAGNAARKTGRTGFRYNMTPALPQLV